MRSQPFRSTCTSMPGCAASKALAIFSAVCSSIEVYQTIFPSFFALASRSGDVAVGSGAAAEAAPAAASSATAPKTPPISDQFITSPLAFSLLVTKLPQCASARQCSGGKCSRTVPPTGTLTCERRGDAYFGAVVQGDEIVAIRPEIGLPHNLARGLFGVRSGAAAPSGVSSMSCSRTDTEVSPPRPVRRRSSAAAARRNRPCRRRYAGRGRCWCRR